MTPPNARNTYICKKEEIFRSLGDTDCVKHTTKIQSKSNVFYNIVIFKCMNDFLFVKSLLFINCALNAKTNNVIPSNS